MSNALVIDISRYQKDPDWDALKKGGTIGVILKATQSTAYVDPTFKKRYVEARTAGLQVATYHYLTFGQIEPQMDHYVKTVNPSDGDRLVIDYEATGLDLNDLRTAVKRLKQLAPKCEITVYGASGFLGYHLGDVKDELLATTSLWVASYTTASKPTMRGLTGTWPTWSLWQYSDKGEVSGIDGNVDVNRWNGDPAKLPGWFHAGNVQPDPTPVPVEPPPVVPAQPAVVEIKVPDGVQVVVSVNGKLLA